MSQVLASRAERVASMKLGIAALQEILEKMGGSGDLDQVSEILARMLNIIVNDTARVLLHADSTKIVKIDWLTKTVHLR